MYDASLLSTDAGLSGSGSAGVAGAQAGGSGAGSAGVSVAGGGTGGDDSEAGAAGVTPGSDAGSAGRAGGGGAGIAGAPAGGGAGTGGSSGSAGSAGGPAGGATGGLALELISSMENGTTLDQVGGRNGDFYVGNDATAGGTQFPGSPFLMSALPTTDSRYSASDKMAAMTNGMGFTNWGENIGFNFNLVNGSTGKHPLYDASAYCGLHFFVKVGASPAATRVIVRFTDKYSLPDGGVCGVGGAPCYHYFQKQFDFTPTWQEKSVLFTDFTCLDCQKPALDPSVLYGVEFGLPPSNKFELWFDDMSFLKKPTSGGCPKSL